ncbi:hypothetical protein DPMN_088532 [Dreissena polymorpha]|uniref:Uncharacterized protein n=1 Tax=Dreissena polymorpha TaxID=45954 RepID=A0A9D4KU97_DREPO|nr:hypothetical protein DPMN_088532 [Dreissena polymorpha]
MIIIITISSSSDIIGTNLLTKFHEYRKINVASRVFTRKNAPPPCSHFHKDRTVNVASRVLTRFYYSHIRKNAPPLGSHVFQANIIIFKLIQDIIETNLLTKFHADWTLNVAYRVLTRFYYSHIKPYKEKCPAPPGGHVFKATNTIFELIQDIIGTNLLTKFHDDRKINVTSRVLTRKNAPPRGGHVFQPTGIIFKLVQDIIGMNLLTEFHEDQTINVASRVLTRLKNAPPLGSHVFQANVTIFELIQDINKTNLLTKFHEDLTINVASRVLTRKNAPPPGGHVCQPTGIIFELVQDIIGLNLLIKFHDDWTINVASRVLTRFYYSHIRKNASPFGSHIFQSKVTIFELIQDIIGTNLLTKFHEDRKINVASRVLKRKNAPPPWRPYIIGMNLLTKFHDDQTINVASRVKNAPPLGRHVFQANVTIFELIQDIIETNLLTKFHEDWTINVASRELTRQMLTLHNACRTTHDGQKAITKAHHEHVVLRQRDGHTTAYNLHSLHNNNTTRKF